MMLDRRTYTILLLMLLVTACAAAFAAETAIYAGQPVAQLGITLGPWGSGNAEETADRAVSGGRSIKITSEGWFSGGSVEFATPVKLFSGTAPAGQFLALVIAPTLQQQIATSGADQGWYMRASRSTAGSYDFGAESVQMPKIEKLKLVLVSGKGKRTEVIQNVPSANESGWLTAGLPLSKLKLAPGETDYTLKRILVFSDIDDIIYLGAIKVVEDNEPIKVDPDENLSYAIGDPVVLHARATGGLSILKASWDFDDKDGIQADGVGNIIKHVYTKPGDYVVTLKVSDTSGAKTPVTKTIKVHIE